jgi:hypothetical protein
VKLKLRLLLWAPRVLGLALCLFVGMFALDAFSEGLPFTEALAAFLLHLLPTLLLLAAVVLAWRWEWVGAVAFIGLAGLYAFDARRHLEWVALISGPLLAVGLLYLWGWRHHAQLHADRHMEAGS